MRTFFYILMLVVFSNVSAQISSTWKQNLDGNFEWHFANASGNYLVKTSTGLHCFSPEDGKHLWTNQLLFGIIQDNVSELPNSGFLLITDNNNKIVLNPFSGEVIFESEKLGYSELTYQNFMPLSNLILVAGKKGKELSLSAIDATTGKNSWNLTEKFGKIFSIHEQDENKMIVVTLFNVYQLESKTGQLNWKSPLSGAEVPEESEILNLLADVANEMASDLETEIVFFKDEDLGVFVVASETEHNKSLDNGKQEQSFSSEYRAFSLKDGKALWENEVLARGKISQVFFKNNGVVILPSEKTRARLNYYKFEGKPDGEWGKKGRGIKNRGGVEMAMDLGDNLFLLASSSGTTKGYIDFLAVNEGELQLKKPVKVKGNIQKITPLKNAIFYVTDVEADVISIASGESLLGKSIPTNPSLVEETDGYAYLFDEKSNTVKGLDLTSFEVTEISTEKVKFKGKETPTRLEIFEGQFLLTSSQNIAMIDKDGNLAYQTYFDAPKETGLMKALLYAQAIRAAYIGANAYAASASLQSYQNPNNDQATDALVSGIGMAYQEIGDQASDFVKESFARAKNRAKATTETREYLIILTQQDKNTSLLKVSKTNGEAIYNIDLGGEKNPTYTLDDVTGKLFLLTNDNQIEMFKL